MCVKLPKQLLTLGIGTSILLSTLVDSASAVTLNYSGRFGDDVSCTIEGPPSDRRCSFEDLKGGSFSGFLELDESGALNRNVAPPRLDLFNRTGTGMGQEFFIVAGVNFTNNIANLVLDNNFAPSSEQFLTVSFEAPGVTSVTEPFGAFIDGTYRKRDGLARRISQSIDIVDASITTRVPEGSLILGLFSCFSLSWFLKKQKTSKA